MIYLKSYDEIILQTFDSDYALLRGESFLIFRPQGPLISLNFFSSKYICKNINNLILSFSNGLNYVSVLYIVLEKVTITMYPTLIPKSSGCCFVHICWAQQKVATFSSSTIDRATQFYFRIAQDTRLYPKKGPLQICFRSTLYQAYFSSNKSYRIN